MLNLCPPKLIWRFVIINRSTISDDLNECWKVFSEILKNMFEELFNMVKCAIIHKFFPHVIILDFPIQFVIETHHHPLIRFSNVFYLYVSLRITLFHHILSILSIFLDSHPSPHNKNHLISFH